MSIKNVPTDVVPWTATLNFMSSSPPFENSDGTGPTLTWDYNFLGSWYIKSGFLAVWSGDGRYWPSNGNNSVIMSDYMQ